MACNNNINISRPFKLKILFKWRIISTKINWNVN